MYRQPFDTGRRPSMTPTYFSTLTSMVGWNSSLNFNKDLHNNTKNNQYRSGNNPNNKKKEKRRKYPEPGLEATVKKIRKDIKVLPSAMLLSDSYATGSKHCDKCSIKKEDYKKIMQNIKMIDLVVDGVIEKEQADLMDNSNEDDEEIEDKNHEDTRNSGQSNNKENKLSFKFEVTCGKGGLDHSLQCVLINLQNTIGEILVQVCYVKSNQLGNVDKFKKFNISVDDLRLLKFEYTNLTDKIIMLFKKPSREGLSKSGICVECVKEKLFVHNESLVEMLKSGKNLKLVMRNSESNQGPGQCCRRSYPHLHAEAQGKHIVLKYSLPFKTGKPPEEISNERMLDDTHFGGVGGNESEQGEPEPSYEPQPFKTGKSPEEISDEGMLDDTHFGGVGGDESEQGEPEPSYEPQPFKSGNPLEEITDGGKIDDTHVSDADSEEVEQDEHELNYEPQFGSSTKGNELYPSKNNGRNGSQISLNDENTNKNEIRRDSSPSNQPGELSDSQFTQPDKIDSKKSPSAKIVTFKSIESSSSVKYQIPNETRSKATHDIGEDQERPSTEVDEITSIVEFDSENNLIESTNSFLSKHTSNSSGMNNNSKHDSMDHPTQVKHYNNFDVNEPEIRSALTRIITLPVQSRHSLASYNSSTLDERNVLGTEKIVASKSLSSNRSTKDDEKEFEKVCFGCNLTDTYEELGLETFHHASNIENLQKSETVPFDDRLKKETDVLPSMLNDSKFHFINNSEGNYLFKNERTKEFNQTVGKSMVETQKLKQNSIYKDPIDTSNQKTKRVSFSDGVRRTPGRYDDYAISSTSFGIISNKTYNDILEDENESLMSEQQVLKDITHPNKQVEEILCSFGKDSLMKISSPAACSQGLPLLEKIKNEPDVPIRPSLYSLPLDREDLLYIARELGKSIEINPDIDTPVVKYERKEEEERRRNKANKKTQNTKWKREFAGTETPSDHYFWKRNSAKVTSKEYKYNKDQDGPKCQPTITEEYFFNGEVKTQDKIQFKRLINQESTKSIFENIKSKRTSTEPRFCTVQVDNKYIESRSCFGSPHLKKNKNIVGTKYSKNSKHRPYGSKRASLATSLLLKRSLKENNSTNYSQFQSGDRDYTKNGKSSALTSNMRDFLSLALEEMIMLSAIHLLDVQFSNPVIGSRLRTSITKLRNCKNEERYLTKDKSNYIL